MTANEAYFSAVIPEPVAVLRRELRPFSPGHLVLLHRTGSVFVRGGEITEGQLAHAVLICGQTFRDGVASLNDPALPAYLKKWRKELGRTFDLNGSAAIFRKYLETGAQIPLRYCSKENDGAPIVNLTLVHAVRCALKHHYHTGEEEFWDMPWALALWDYYSIGVLAGRGELVEESSIQSALDVADELFRKLNPQLFKPDGTPKEAPCRN